jgi:membrane protein implicated in regulation of membrane protease activity
VSIAEIIAGGGLLTVFVLVALTIAGVFDDDRIDL